jgi:uncharacterized DUF497 family protein
VRITFDSAKRAATLKDRGLDFADAEEVFAGETYNEEDQRKDYGETRIRTIGFLAGRLVAIVWTPRGRGRRVISMRKCNAKEQAYYRQRLRAR